MEPNKKGNVQNASKKISIRNIYKQRKLDRDKQKQKIKRYTNEEFAQKFANIKKTGNARIGELYDLFRHNNLNPEFLEFYFLTLFRLDKNKFKNQIQLFYPFMNMKSCRKFNIKKINLKKIDLYNYILK